MEKQDDKALVWLTALLLLGSGAALMLTASDPELRVQDAIRRGSIGLSILAVGTAVTAQIVLSRQERPAFIGLMFPMLYGLFFGFSTLAWASGARVPISVRLMVGLPSVLSALNVAALGLIAWLVGWIWLPRRLRERKKTRNSLEQALDSLSTKAPRRKNIMYVYALGLVARLGVIATGSFAYITSDLNRAVTSPNPIVGLLARMDVLTIFAILLMLARTIETPDDRKARWLLVGMLMLELGFSLLSGTKMGLFLRLLTLGWGVRILSGKMPWKTISIGLLSIAPIVLFTDAYRKEVRAHNRTVVTASQAASLLIPTGAKVLTSSDGGELKETSLKFVFQRFRGIDGLAIVLQKTPEKVGFVPPSKSLQTIPASLIPRLLWPGKPVYVEGLAFARQYFGQDSKTFNSLSPSVIGDLYRRGGLAIVALGMFVMGRFGRRLTLAALVGSFPHRFVILAPVAIDLLGLENGLVLLPATLLQVFACMLLGIRIATLERKTNQDGNRHPVDSNPVLGLALEPVR
jgi:hypothetical protein